MDKHADRFHVTVQLAQTDQPSQEIVLESAKVILAPGRDGAEWFVNEARRLGLKMRNKGVDVGVRVEVRNRQDLATPAIQVEQVPSGPLPDEHGGAPTPG